MRACFFPLNIDAAGCYRCIFPMAYLGERGHMASMPGFVLAQNGKEVRPLPGPGVLNRVPPGQFDVLFVEETIPEDLDLAVFHIGTMGWQVDWARKMVKRGVRVVLDLDDDVHRNPGYNPAVLDRRSSPHNNRWNTQQLCELADLVTCATPSIAEFYSQWNPNTVVVRNALHWPMWDRIDRGAGWSRFRVGYMGNMAFHGADIDTIAPQLRKWLVAHPEVEFVAAGDPSIHDRIGVPESQRVSTSNAWFRMMDLAQITACMDVGLVPLAKNAFNEGKSCLKGMEYAACGIPCIASPTGEYQRWLDGGGGILAKHPKDWLEALDTLYEDEGLRARLANEAFAHARAESLDNRVTDWEDAYGWTGGDHHTNAAVALPLAA